MSKIFLFLTLVEFLITNLSFHASVYYFRYYETIPGSLNAHHVDTIGYIFAFIIVLTMTSVGLYQRGQSLGPSMLMKMAVAFLISSITLFFIFLMFTSLNPGREILASAMMISFVGVLSFRSLFFHLIGADALKRRVMIVGTGKSAGELSDLEKNSQSFSIISYAYVKDKDLKIPFKFHMPEDWALPDYVYDNDIDEIVIAVDDRRKNLPHDEILDCKMMGVEVMDTLSFQEKELYKINIDLLYPSWMVFGQGFRLGFFSKIFKRLFDITVSFSILILMTPVMALIALLSLLESRFQAPVFFHQDRVGQNGRIFRLHKFRSMVVDAESASGAKWATMNDHRITLLGRFIRKTRLDELPQLINILRGEMSIIGPRPERPEFVKQLVKTVPFYDVRHRYKPGLAGWAQLRYPYGASEEDARQKLQYDLYYIKNASLFLDFMILIETVEVVLWGKGAH